MAEQDLFEREVILDELKRTLDVFPTDETKFLARCRDIVANQRKFLKLQTKIEKTLMKNNTFIKEDELGIRSMFNDLYYTVLGHVETLKESQNEQRRASRSFSVPTACSHSHERLPTLPLPSFNGESTDWQSYFDLFLSLVHNKSTYSDTEKFRYLLLTLKDEPLNLVKSIPITDENYSVALEILISRYQNKRAIASKHLDRILDIESCSESVQSLRKLLNTYHENMQALDRMQFPVDQWSFLLLGILLRKIPNSLRKRFELSLQKPTDIPNVKLLIEFLERELSACVISDSSSTRNKNQGTAAAAGRPITRSSAGGSNVKLQPRQALAVNVQPENSTSKSKPLIERDKPKNCLACNEPHHLSKCNKFLNLSPSDRFNLVKGNNVCYNCLSTGHDMRQCKSNFVCRSCFKRHHTLIHFDKADSTAVSLPLAAQEDKMSADSSSPDLENAHLAMASTNHARTVRSAQDSSIRTSTVLLSTALVNVCVGIDRRATVRCLIDTGSQATFITESCAQRLGLQRRNAMIPVHGIGDGKPVLPKGIVSCRITPTDAPQPSISVEALILPKLIPKMPSMPLPKVGWPHIKNLKLADPSFYNPQEVEMLVGADILSHILLGDVVTGSPGSPIAMNSIFGYLLLGSLSFESTTPPRIQACFSSLDDDGDLKRFWELEAVPEERVLTPEERLCEQIYESSHIRDSTGRYIVALPFRPDAQPLGESRDIALARFHKLERRLERNPKLKTDYHACLQEYLDLEHMETVEDAPASGHPYYIPHHCVVKESSETTKTRVVFDASCKTSNGNSLNDILLTGPKLHQDIVDILLKFRVHSIVFTADIKQMYRNILVRECDRDFQRLLWRSSPDEPIKEFRLCTVTFGVSSSPYLALRTIKQLAHDESSHFGQASAVLLDQVFVDDVITGECDENKALTLQRDLIGICATAGFELRKWHSNSPAILAAVQTGDAHGERPTNVPFAPMENDHQTKVLGLQWNPHSDHFTFSVQCNSDKITKRTILSQIAKIYDPMGWLSPVTVYAKHLMQLLWISGVGWDDRPPTGIINSWVAFIQELPLLSQVCIPRHVFYDRCSLQLHGYADASEKAYAACVYLRLTDENGQTRVHLLLAKTRVAPISPSLSIPRLELMAALLLSRLIDAVLRTYHGRLETDEVYAWSDSSIVLAWLRSPPYEWKIFVSNRTSEILTIVPSDRWRHVPSADNPADAPSRGMLPSTFLENDLWFHGPQWLSQDESFWPVRKDILCTSEEKRTVPLTSTVAVSNSSVNDLDLINRFSTLNKLVRVTSYIFRFYNLLKGKINKENISFPPHISVREYNFSLNRLIYLVQQSTFSEDIKNISQNKFVSNQLQRVNPFIDKDNFLRVGGRIHKSLLAFQSKHQLILPKKHNLTNLIIDDAHVTQLHAGTQTVQYLLLQKYWILSSRDIIRQRIHKCVRCFRARPARIQPRIGPLPASRVRPERPFLKTSVDFSGPHYVRANKVRNAKVIKCYVAVFVCMSVKAIHLELVSELSSEAFLAALRRFTSRRGLCTDIYSDCGKNFVGCNNQLKELYQFLKNDHIQNALNAQTLQQGITWHFQPPYASHFGGLFESGVRCFKHHLKRVIGTQTLTYDEMHTLLNQIEAVLNSRPLCVTSADSDDPLPLTPAHFLIGGPLTAIPDVPLTESNPNRLLRWRWVQQCLQHFWKRWSREYLHEIQQRGKWYRDQGPPIREGTVVVVCDDNLPPLQWKLARVHALHPGSDNITRVVTLQSGSTFFKRAVVKICPLPIE